MPTYNWLGDPAVALKRLLHDLVNRLVYGHLFSSNARYPESLYEAATIDGANWWDKFVCITLPFLQPVTFFVVVMGIIGTFQLFDQSYIFRVVLAVPITQL